MNWLKEILGEGYTEETGKKVSAHLAGAYIPADTHKSVQTQLESANARIQAMTDELQELKKADPSAMQAKLDTALTDAANWKSKAEDAEKQAAEKIAAIAYDGAVDSHVSKIRFSSDLAKEAYAAKLKEKGLKLDGGKLLGADDFAKEMRETNPTAFVQESGGAGFSGKQPVGEAKNGNQAINNAIRNFVRGE